MASEFDVLMDDLGYRFRNTGLLSQALRHSSYVNERVDSTLEDNERLEFLGDAVLDLAISDLLMERFRHLEEGSLSKFRAMVVDETGLCSIAKYLRLGEYLSLGKGEEQSGGRDKPSILANAMESLLGAVYLDAGYKTAKEIIRNHFRPLIETLEARGKCHDYKSLLQEYTQLEFQSLPSYRVIDTRGPAHDRTFCIEVLLKGETLARSEGKSKKEAEQRAAEEAYSFLAKG